ncbi:hypothetical protein Esti_003671 [Eimeria stiedai]
MRIRCCCCLLVADAAVSLLLGPQASAASRGSLLTSRSPGTEVYTKLSGFFGNRPPPPAREAATVDLKCVKAPRVRGVGPAWRLLLLLRLPVGVAQSVSTLLKACVSVHHDASPSAARPGPSFSHQGSGAASSSRLSREVEPRERKRRTINALLNKLTIDNFGVVCEKIALEAEQFESVHDLELLSSLLFSKAVSEPEYSEMYADLYLVLRWRSPEFSVPGEDRKTSFHRTFVNRCQDEFEKLQGDGRLSMTPEEQAECQDRDDEVKLLLKKKTRVLGNMRFIGQLFLRRGLSPKVLNDVVHSLVFGNKAETFPDEHFIECLTELLTTIGYTMDQQTTSRGMMSEFLGKLQELQLKAGYSSRIVFRIQDLLDLRQRRWTKKVFTEVAKSVAEIREDAKRDELMGGTIMVAQDGVFRTVGQRRDMPYNDYIEEQRQRAELKRAAALAGVATPSSAAAPKAAAAAFAAPPAGSAAAPKAGAAAMPSTFSRAAATAAATSPSTGGAFSRSGLTLASGAAASGAAATPAAASAGAAPGGAASAGGACPSGSRSSSSEAAAAGLDAVGAGVPLRQDVDLLVFEFVTEGAPIEGSLSEWRSLGLGPADSARQIAAVLNKALGDARVSKAPRYAVLICKLLIEHLQATKELKVLLETLDGVVLSQLHEVAVDNPRAPEFCGEIFGPFFAAQTQGPSPLGEMGKLKLLFPLPDSEAVCKEILRRVEKDTPERVAQLRSVFEASLVARVPGCSAAAAGKLLAG